MNPVDALNFLAACARKVLTLEQAPQYEAAIKALLPLIPSAYQAAPPVDKPA